MMWQYILTMCATCSAHTITALEHGNNQHIITQKYKITAEQKQWNTKNTTLPQNLLIYEPH